MKKRLVSRFLLRASHSLQIAGDWSEAPHGHHYHLQVTWSCGSDLNVAAATSWVKQHLIDPLDQKELNALLVQSSGEAILLWVEAQLSTSPYGHFVAALQLDETKKNSFQKTYGLKAK